MKAFYEHHVPDLDVKLVGTEADVMIYRRRVAALREAAANAVASQRGDISRKPFIGRLREALAMWPDDDA